MTRIALPRPMSLRPDFSVNWRAMLRITLPIFLIVSLRLFALGRIPAAVCVKLRTWLHAFTTRPVRALALVVALGAIVFEYWPRRFTGALALSAIGFGALLGAAWFVRRCPGEL
jgi:hypothetical protein